MFDQLSGLAYGLIIFAIIIGVGTIVLYNFGNTVGGDANTTVQYLMGKLGSTSGGLASWTPAIVAIAVGLLFLGAFAFGKKRK